MLQVRVAGVRHAVRKLIDLVVRKVATDGARVIAAEPPLQRLVPMGFDAIDQADPQAGRRLAAKIALRRERVVPSIDNVPMSSRFSFGVAELRAGI